MKHVHSVSGEGSSIDKITILHGSDVTIANLTLEARIELLKNNIVWERLANWIKQNTN